MAEVKFTGVGKTYAKGDRPAVADFNLTVRDGEFLVLVGPSGCGKSTTLRMVAGLELPTGGRIEIGGRDVTNLPPKDRDIAMVFQNYALYPHMTVKENLSFALKLRRCAKGEIERRVAAAAESLGLTPYLKRLPKALSGGQRQRVALGRAIVREPSVFLFDEPLSNLDAKMRVEMRAEIIRLHNRLGATMIYVTHDQTEAMTMGERIVVMSEGRIQQVAPPLEIYERPANPFVAGFIGTPQMNFFDVKLKREQDKVFVIFSNGDQVTIPYEKVSKIHSHYLTGKLPVIFGIRPEHIDLTNNERGLKFIVTPPMNLFPTGTLSPLRTVGLRPEHLKLERSTDAGRLIAKVDFLEPLGSETLVHVVLKALDFRAIARIPGFSDLKPGESVAIVPDMSRAVEF